MLNNIIQSIIKPDIFIRIVHIFNKPSFPKGKLLKMQ